MSDKTDPRLHVTDESAECWCEPETILVPPRGSDAELLAWLGADARKWAAAFMDAERRLERYADEGMLVGWFANAIEAGRSAATGQVEGQESLIPDPRTTTEVVS